MGRVSHTLATNHIEAVWAGTSQVICTHMVSAHATLWRIPGLVHKTHPILSTYGCSQKKQQCFLSYYGVYHMQSKSSYLVSLLVL